MATPFPASTDAFVSKRFGASPPEALAAIEAIDTAASLQALADRLLEVESWQELLGREKVSRSRMVRQVSRADPEQRLNSGD